jgi:hypothetical protein
MLACEAPMAGTSETPLPVSEHGNDSVPAGGAAFALTHWSVVLTAGGNESDSVRVRDAL